MRYFDIYDYDGERGIEILELTISDHFISQCADILLKNSFVNKKSFMKGERSLTGVIGETAVRALVKKEWNISLSKTAKSDNNSEYYDYDLYNDKYKIEIKSKTCKSVPKSDYEGSVPVYYEQECDYYLFNRVLDNHKTIWIMGFIAKKDFENKRRKIEKGEIDKSNGLVFKENAYNIFYHELNPIRGFEKILKGD